MCSLDRQRFFGPAPAYRLARLTRVDHSAVQGPGGRGHGGDHGICTDRDPRAHEGPGSEPCAVLEDDRGVAVPHVDGPVIVIARAEDTPLGQTTMRPYRDGSEVDDAHLLTHPRVIPNRQVPGEVYVDPRLEIHLPPHPRPEAPQDECFEPRGPWQGREEKRTLYQVPQTEKPTRPPSVEAFMGVKEVIAHAAVQFIGRAHLRGQVNLVESGVGGGVKRGSLSLPVAPFPYPCQRTQQPPVERPRAHSAVFTRFCPKVSGVQRLMIYRLSRPILPKSIFPDQSCSISRARLWGQMDQT